MKYVFVTYQSIYFKSFDHSNDSTIGAFTLVRYGTQSQNDRHVSVSRWWAFPGPINQVQETLLTLRIRIIYICILFPDTAKGSYTWHQDHHYDICMVVCHLLQSLGRVSPWGGWPQARLQETRPIWQSELTTSTNFSVFTT